MNSDTDEAQAKIATLAVELDNTRAQADGVLLELHKAQNTAADMRAQLSILSIQHEALLQEHRAVCLSRDSVEESKKRKERQLHAHVEDSASALRKMESHLQHLSRTVRSQHEEIVSLQSTVELQCRERLMLQERVAGLMQ